MLSLFMLEIVAEEDRLLSMSWWILCVHTVTSPMLADAGRHLAHRYPCVRMNLYFWARNNVFCTRELIHRRMTFVWMSAFGKVTPPGDLSLVIVFAKML